MLLLLSQEVSGQTWQEALARMPLPPHLQELTRTNCVEVMLGAFQSNRVVKALVFMPGATDEFYLFQRARATLTNPVPSLLDAVSALTQQTRIQASFVSPLLLLHTDSDPLAPEIHIQDPRTAQGLKESRTISHVFCHDRDWDSLQPILRRSLRIDIRPWPHSMDSWHFYRHSFAGWGLSGWEGLEATALAGKTRFTVGRKRVTFELDRR